MRNGILVALLLLVGVACEDSVDSNDEQGELYTPYVTSTRGNGKVTLQWGKPACLFCLGCPCPQAEPEYFEILTSTTDPADLKPYTTVDESTFEITVDKLTNGTPYYFAIRAVGSFNHSVTSDTIMTIPDPPENVRSLFQTTNKDRILGTWSPDQSSVAYISNYQWNNGNNSAWSLFLSALLSQTEWLVESNARSPEWSPDGNRIAYQTDNGEINTSPGYRPTHIAVLNLQDSSVTRLTTGTSFNFLPTWSPDGDWIAFLSDKAGTEEYNLWKIPVGGGSPVQITSDFNDLDDLGIKDDRSPKTLSWSRDGDRVAFARMKESAAGHDFDIYSVPSGGGTRTIVVSSPWNEVCPAYSPDGTTIAFVSNRSGMNEIWTMSLENNILRQITGSTGKTIYENSGKIEWSSSGDEILYTSNEGSYYTLYAVRVD